MLIRIAPQMFRNSNFECVTIRCIREEVFRTQKFKDKYPWRINYKSNIIHISNSKIDKEVMKVIERISDESLDKKTGRPYDLSYEDKNIVACAVSNDYTIGTGDDNLIKFAKNEFNIQSFKSTLDILNLWLQKGLITWSEKLNNILEEWKLQEEKKQPRQAKFEFKRLTGKEYPGP